ncbi:MAG TPA: DUF2214 family protein [Solimonas sp.]
MLETVILPWLHYVAILMMAGGAVAELYLLRLPPQADSLRLLVRVDRFYGISATIVLVTGILRMYHGGKGADWYWSNGLMHGVIGAFVLGMAISLVPTLRFLCWNRALAQRGALPDAAALRRTGPLLHAQLLILAAIALLITLVARGYGVSAS